MIYNNYSLFIKGLKKGDEKAYEFLIDNYYRKIYAYAVSLINDKTIAEDIVQNVLLKTWQYRKKLDASLSIQSFLYKSVYNEFVNTYQKSKATTYLHYKYLENLEEITTSVDDNKIEYFFKIVTKEIEKLPPKCKNIFMLSKVDGLTNIEIAEYLDISIKTVEAQITKAYCVLRGKLGDQYKSVLFIYIPKK
ncbi:RNA polymerase sigma factor [Joostella sp.]|uniref:RNA polymerase sigma factor n=1 Tax=Joostella sp. TaxID=2231138 RepID=UPI003A8E8069